MTSFVDRTIKGSCSLAVRDYGGTGNPVLLLHGMGRTLADLTGIATRLAQQHQVVAMDLRCHGRSQAAAWKWDAVVEDVAAVVNGIGLDRPAIVGHSLGGMIAALYSTQGGEHSCIVNMDGYGHGTADQYIGESPQAVSEYLAKLKDAGLASWPGGSGLIDEDGLRALQRAARSEAEVIGIPAELELDNLDRSIRGSAGSGYQLSPNAAALTEMYDALSDIHWFSVFRRVTSPFLIYNCIAEIVPLLDLERQVEFMSAYRRGLARDLKQLAAGSRTVTVRTVEAQHMFILTQPDDLAAEIHDFISAAAANRDGLHRA